MEEYKPIELIITPFDAEDVITTSGGGSSGGDNPGDDPNHVLNPDLYEGGGYYSEWF